MESDYLFSPDPEGEVAEVQEQPTLQQQLQLVKEGRSRDKKYFAKLTAKAKAELLQKREEKEVGRFLLPDAPPSKKQKRNSCPKRIPCPLVPGTPTTPPPRKRLPCEYDSDNEERPGPSQDFGLGGYGDNEVDLISIPGPLIESSSSLISDSLRKRKLPTEERNVGICLSPKTVIEYWSANPDAEVSLELGSSVSSMQSTPSQSPSTRVEGFDLKHIRGIGEEQEEEREVGKAPKIVVEIDERRELLPDATVTQARRSDDPVGFAKPSSKYVCPLRDDEIEMELMNDLSGLCDSGSEDEDELDIDTMDDNQFIPINLSRDASNFPAHDDELPASIAQQLLDNDIRDSEALREIGDGHMVSFEWRSDPNTFCGVKETFTGEAGPTFATEGLTPLEIFEKIFDDTMIEEIVRQTNIYAHNLLSAPNLKPSSRLRKWKDCTKKDIWTFIAILMLQSLMPCAVEAKYWFPKSPLLKVSDFNSLMSYSRFVLIKKCLHFVDNAIISQVTGPKKKLAKIQPLIDYLNDKFSSLYVPEQNIAIDESLLLWKGRLSFSQLIKNKAAQVGIKSYELCESRTGYLWQIKVYSGKGVKNASQDNANENELQNATSQIVLNLVRPLLNKGHVLVMDNYYNSPLLSRILKKEKTDTMGTLRLNREFVPDSLKYKNKSNLQPGEVAFSHTKDLSIVVWRDSNIVSLISTFHKAAVSGKEKFGFYKYKPQVVLDYNLSMGGVDKKDQLLQAFPIERVRNKIWYKKLFRRLLNVSIHNSYVIASHSRNILHREFRETLLLNIVNKYCTHPVIKNPKTSIALGGHYPTKNSTARARCKVCSQKHKIDTRTTWKCDTCNVSLCTVGCFKYYHENMYTAPL